MPEVVIVNEITDEIVIVNELADEIVIIENVGLKGEKGDIGLAGANYATLPTASVLGGHRVIASLANTLVYADNTNNQHSNTIVGLSTGASSGSALTLQSSGFITEPSWTWTPDLPIFLSTNGLMTQTQPLIGFSILIATAITSTTVFLRFNQPITLS
jgi:hypothetical protein